MRHVLYRNGWLGRRVAYALALRYFEDVGTGKRFMRQTFHQAVAIEMEPRPTNDGS
jgi:hypothetical protein